MAPRGNSLALALLLALLATPALISAVDVPTCSWSSFDRTCDLGDASITALVGSSGRLTGFEGMVAKIGAFSALCAGTVEADCPLDTCTWNATTSQCSDGRYANMATQLTAVLDCPGTKGGEFLACVIPSIVAGFTGDPVQCDGACSMYEYTDPDRNSTSSVCVPTNRVSAPVEEVTDWIMKVLNFFVSSESKYEPELYGCCPGYILYLLDTKQGCGAARTKAACAKRGQYSTFCEWDTTTGSTGGSCTSSDLGLFKFGQRPSIVNTVQACQSYKTRKACTNDKVALPDHAALLKFIEKPNPQPMMCPDNYWDAVKAWARPR